LIKISFEKKKTVEGKGNLEIPLKKEKIYEQS